MKSEKEMASNLLRFRKKGFPSPLAGLFGISRTHLLRYLVLGVLILMLIANWADHGLRSFLFFGLGTIIGAMLAETGFLIRVRRMWPFTKKVTDWDTVSELAGTSDQVEVKPKT